MEWTTRIIFDKINEALTGLTQQEAYDIIISYKRKLEHIYPMIKLDKKRQKNIERIKIIKLLKAGVIINKQAFMQFYKITPEDLK
jgi:hypothetical protein